MRPPNVPLPTSPRVLELSVPMEGTPPLANEEHAAWPNARRGVSILMAGVILSASIPSLARADVALPPPPPAKKGAVDLPPPPPKSGGSGGVDLPPPPKKKGGDSGGSSGGKGGDSGGSSGGGSSSGGGGGGGASTKRTTGLVLLVTGGVVSVAGTVMLLLGAGLKPNGKSGGSNTGLLVGGAVTTGIGLTIAAVGLVILLDSNNGRLPPLRSLELQHPAMRTPTWASASMPGLAHDGPAFVLPFGGTF